MMKPIRFLLLVLVSLAFSTAPPLAGEKIGVILMHGKGGTAMEKSPVGKLKYALEVEDFIVVAPDMPWSRSREFDKSYKDSMAEIDEAVKELKDKGATKIVVGGHSIGANAALGYGARREGLAGILAIAPGHIPESEGFQEQMNFDYKRAKDMIAAGKGGDEADFKDVNQGRKSTKTMTANVYQSWYDPEGPAQMPKNAANLKPGTPLMWIIGEKDRMMDRGEEYAFAKAPAHPKNAYVVVGGGHRATPSKGKKKIIDWLKGL